MFLNVPTVFGLDNRCTTKIILDDYFSKYLIRLKSSLFSTFKFDITADHFLESAAQSLP